VKLLRLRDVALEDMQSWVTKDEMEKLHTLGGKFAVVSSPMLFPLPRKEEGTLKDEVLKRGLGGTVQSPD
jgi:hypothetical protein